MFIRIYSLIKNYNTLFDKVVKMDESIDTGNAMDVINELKQEICELRADLERSTEENVKAAEYGLLMLEEKRTLTQQIEDSESFIENMKHELNCAKEVCLFYSNT